MRSTPRVMTFLVLLGMAASPWLAAQSLVQVADKEKQRREASSVDETNDRDDVIDEYSLAGYKPINVAPASPEESRATEDEPDGQASQVDSDSAAERLGALERRMKRSCSMNPQGVVCASLRQRVRDQTTGADEGSATDRSDGTRSGLASRRRN